MSQEGSKFGHPDISRLSEVYLDAAEIIAGAKLEPKVEVNALVRDTNKGGELIVVSGPEVAWGGIQIILALRTTVSFKGASTPINRHNRQTVAHLLGYGLSEIDATVPPELVPPTLLGGVRTEVGRINERLLATYTQSPADHAEADGLSRLNFTIARKILLKPL